MTLSALKGYAFGFQLKTFMYGDEDYEKSCQVRVPSFGDVMTKLALGSPRSLLFTERAGRDDDSFLAPSYFRKFGILDQEPSELQFVKFLFGITEFFAQDLPIVFTYH